MNVKKIKRKCMVRGCKNIDTFAISNNREMGNSVIICKSCLEKGLDAVLNYTPQIKSSKTSIPPLLFFGDGTKSDTKEENHETEIFICPKCGKEFKTAAGLSKHSQIHSGGGLE